MRVLAFSLFLIVFHSFGQQVLVLGKNIPLESSKYELNFIYKDSIDSLDLNQFKALIIFSTANSTISETDEKRLIDYVKAGGNMYLGAENSPFFAESNQLLKSMYNFQAYGDFSKDTLLIDSNSNLKTENKKYITGYSTVSFPMDYRLQVEAWSKDNPIILSGKFGQGKLIIDGGYSRFNELEKTIDLFDEILGFFFSSE